MQVLIYDHTLTHPINTPLAFTVDRYSHSVLGGPLAATLRATGTEADLSQLLDWLRCGVEIYDDLGVCVWWGYLEAVTLHSGPVQISLDLSQMANRVAVAYSTIAPGDSQTFERRTTPWVEDPQSIARFGIKESLLSLSGVTDSQALAHRDSAFQTLSTLIPQLTVSSPQPKANRQSPTANSTALLSCRGWWHTLKWRCASVPVRLAHAHQTIGSLDAPIGQDTGGPITWGYAQAFVLVEDCYLQDLEIYLQTVGAPGDRLKVSIWTNPDDLTPGVQLAAASREGSTLNSGLSWQRFGLPAALHLTAGLRCFLVVERTGSADPAAYYRLRLDQTQSYPAGAMRQKVTSTWQPGPAADLPFRLYANQQVGTGEQIEHLLTDYGQFLRHPQIESGGFTSGSYRDGDATARFEIEQLMRIGTQDGQRLLASVDPSRRVRIYPEPTPHAPWLLTPTGHLRDPSGTPIRPATCPAGIWVRLSGLHSAQFFVESSEYSPLDNKLCLM